MFGKNPQQKASMLKMFSGVTYRKETFADSDNQIVYEADIWVADAAVFEENSTHWLSAGAKVLTMHLYEYWNLSQMLPSALRKGIFDISPFLTVYHICFCFIRLVLSLSFWTHNLKLIERDLRDPTCALELQSTPLRLLIKSKY